MVVGNLPIFVVLVVETYSYKNNYLKFQFEKIIVWVNRSE